MSTKLFLRPDGLVNKINIRNYFIAACGER